MSPHRLLFRLPRSLGLSVLPGRHTPCVHGCVLTIDPDFNVSIEGPSREQLFNQARRFIRTAAKGHGAFALSASLHTPRGELTAIDTWHIVVRAEVVIAAGAVMPDIGAGTAA